MSNERIEIDREELVESPEPERLVITLEDLPPETPASAKQYPGLDNVVPVPGIGCKKSSITDVGSSQIIQNSLAGLIGGFIAWGVTELFFDDRNSAVNIVELFIEIGFWGAVIGAVIGCMLGAAEGFTGKVREKAVNGALVGLGIGFAGGFIGGLVGQLLYGLLGGGHAGTGMEQVLARTLGWALLGMFIGIAEGAPGRARKKILNGLIGGLLGGALGGLAFDFIGSMAHTGAISRMFGIAALGGATGLGIGLVEEARKEAWLRVVAGPQSGKQFIIYDTITRIGTSPKCEIVLINDVLILPEHCRIVGSTRGYILECSAGATVLINGLPNVRASLKKGDVLNIGSSQLIYEDKIAAQAVQGGIPA